jgi:hypothetical protein
MRRRRPGRRQAERLRTAVELLPRHTREAMLRGIDSSPIIVGGYVDGEGGVCPMLAAHRNGGRTSFASFAIAWDAFTGAGRRPRRASRRELRVLRTYLEMSLLAEESLLGSGESLAEIAGRIRTERRRTTRSPKPRGAWLRPARRLDVYEATLAAASEQITEPASVPEPV